MPPVTNVEKNNASDYSSKLFSNVDIHPLIVFRILFGFLLVYQTTSDILRGLVYEKFIKPPFFFPFIGFEFLRPLPGDGMYYYYTLMAVLGLLIMLGAFYRIAITSFTILWTCSYLMQKSIYGQYYYLIILLCFLMIFMPANRYFSIDVKRNPAIKRVTCPQWMIWIFIVQISVVYFYAGFYKLYADWFSGRFMGIMFSAKKNYPLLGYIFRTHVFHVFISYAGILFDLFIVPLLLFKNTRQFAFLLTCVFHVFNSVFFTLGIFPYLALAMNVFFYEPSFIRRLFFNPSTAEVSITSQPIISNFKKKLAAIFFSAYSLIQVIVPLRPLFFKDNVNWTEEGHRMSWRLMLRVKSGDIHFKVIDRKAKKQWLIDPKQTLTRLQSQRIDDTPDIIWQYAQHLKKEFKAKGSDVEVYAICHTSLNRYPKRLFINPNVDLSAEEWRAFKHSDWIMPYK